MLPIDQMALKIISMVNNRVLIPKEVAINLNKAEEMTVLKNITSQSKKRRNVLALWIEKTKRMRKYVKLLTKAIQSLTYHPSKMN